ncbi:gibberellin 3-beta-dioxygenase [Datura stramonium]|uniref:Gibberellin 3-beta-dioxygenase n=1 Tax=Datura stramonium TaxID=4076 RepID=A0ABS8RZ06_DATST|nr:gibberellin 3-beta-dioxygenase [Datura stramonium]
MKWANGPKRRMLCPTTKFLPGLSGSGSGHGPCSTYGFYHINHPSPKQHKWLTSFSLRGQRVGDGENFTLSKLVDQRNPPMYRPVTWSEYLGTKAKHFDKALSSVQLCAPRIGFVNSKDQSGVQVG